MRKLTQEEKRGLDKLKSLLRKEGQYVLAFQLKVTGRMPISGDPHRNAAVLQLVWQRITYRLRHCVRYIAFWGIRGHPVIFPSKESAWQALELIPWGRYSDRPDSLFIYSATVEPATILYQGGSMKIRIKQVPKSAPNAEGDWVKREVHEHFFNNLERKEKWDKLDALCEPYCYAVQYSIVEKRGGSNV